MPNANNRVKHYVRTCHSLVYNISPGMKMPLAGAFLAAAGCTRAQLKHYVVRTVLVAEDTGRRGHDESGT